MSDLSLKCPGGIRDWLRLYKLYISAFPPSERKPVSIIAKMYRQGRSDLWCIGSGGSFLGLAATINADDLILLDYFAVDEKHRGRGIGTAAMVTLLKLYEGKGFFVEIESPYEDGPDREQRLQRKAFYQRCGMLPLNVMADVFGVKMELLGKNCEMDFDRYHAFYRDYYSPWAAQHIRREHRPEE